MEHIIKIHIEKLPEVVFLATSEDIQGLVAQGRTIEETMEIARDVAKKLVEAQNLDPDGLLVAEETTEYPLVVNI